MKSNKALPSNLRAIDNTFQSTGVQPAFSQTRGFVPMEKKVDLPAEGYVRIGQILAPKGPIPVSKATWWAGVKSGRFPQSTKYFGPGITAWDVKEIRGLIEQARLSIET